jgi:hypothetical protein
MHSAKATLLALVEVEPRGADLRPATPGPPPLEHAAQRSPTAIIATVTPWSRAETDPFPLEARVRAIAVTLSKADRSCEPCAWLVVAGRLQVTVTRCNRHATEEAHHGTRS